MPQARPASGPIPSPPPRFDIAALAASVGGLEAIGAVLSGLPDVPAPVLVVQHRAPGRGQDGAAGAAEVRRRGGVVLAQSPDTCVSPSIRRALIAGGGSDFVLPLPTLADALLSLVMASSVSTALFGLPALTAA